MDSSDHQYISVEEGQSVEELRWKDYQLGGQGECEALDGGQGECEALDGGMQSRSGSNDPIEDRFVVKCRRFEDEMIPDLFQEADPLKIELFNEWVEFKNPMDELKLCGFTISDPFTFFCETFYSRKWLDTDHIDLAMLLLRERQVKYPVSFGRFNRTILDSNFHELLKYDTIDIIQGYVEGNVLEYGKKWNGCTHLYYPVCTRKHWIAVEVVFSESTMFIYDCDPNVISASDLEQDLQLASTLIPKLAKLAGISMQDILKIVRVDGLSKQPEPGDCGVYTIKYIEFLSIQESIDMVDDRYMEMWRRKLTVDLFNQNYDP